MSNQAPMARFGGDAPDADEVGERHVVLRVLRKVRVLFVLVPLVVGLLFAASIGAGKLFEDVPVRSGSAPDVTCWNNTTAKAADCPPPTGRAGLRWVFPSFRAIEERCEKVRFAKRSTARPIEFACDVRFDQRAVTITYSVRTSLSQGLSFLQRTYGVVPQREAAGDRLVFRSDAVDDDGNVKVTVAYAEHPFTVTVSAPEPDLRDTALDELVRFRPASQVVVRGDGGIDS